MLLVQDPEKPLPTFKLHHKFHFTLNIWVGKENLLSWSNHSSCLPSNSDMIQRQNTPTRSLGLCPEAHTIQPKYGLGSNYLCSLGASVRFFLCSSCLTHSGCWDLCTVQKFGLYFSGLIHLVSGSQLKQRWDSQCIGMKKPPKWSHYTYLFRTRKCSLN